MLARDYVISVILSCSCFCGVAETRTFSGSVAASLAPYQFTAHFRGPESALAGGLGRIDSIEVRNGDTLLQTIRYSNDDDAPTEFGEPGGLMSLVDVDCDGYKDLLVRKISGEAVNAWFYLYRFNPVSGKFLLYQTFDQLPYESVNCHTKLVHTHMKGALAGCLYEDGLYRWVHGELMPVRIETQDAGKDERAVERTVYAWRHGRKRLQSRNTFALEDCHAQSEHFPKD